LGNLGDGLDRVDVADFVVGGHDAEQRESGCAELGDLVEVESALAVYVEIDQLCPTAFFESLAAVEDGFMFERQEGDAVGSFGVWGEAALDGEIDAFGGTGCPDDFAGGGAD
jgi:hypothetical protein